MIIILLPALRYISIIRIKHLQRFKLKHGINTLLARGTVFNDFK